MTERPDLYWVLHIQMCPRGLPAQSELGLHCAGARRVAVLALGSVGGI